MTISELVAALEAIKAEHGDLECDATDCYGHRISQDQPSVSYRKILGKRECSEDFWCNICDTPAQRGEKVVRL